LILVNSNTFVIDWQAYVFFLVSLFTGFFFICFSANLHVERAARRQKWEFLCLIRFLGLNRSLIGLESRRVRNNYLARLRLPQTVEKMKAMSGIYLNGGVFPTAYVLLLKHYRRLFGQPVARRTMSVQPFAQYVRERQFSYRLLLAGTLDTPRWLQLFASTPVAGGVALPSQNTLAIEPWVEVCPHIHLACIDHEWTHICQSYAFEVRTGVPLASQPLGFVPRMGYELTAQVIGSPSLLFFLLLLAAPPIASVLIYWFT
jgi:hypothetical protein